MDNKTSPVKEYITNLALMSITMGEMIHQLEEIVIENEGKDENIRSS